MTRINRRPGRRASPAGDELPSETTAASTDGSTPSPGNSISFLLIHEAQQGCRDATYEPSRFPVAVPYPSPHRATPAYVFVTSSDLDTSRNKVSVGELSWISRISLERNSPRRQARGRRIADSHSRPGNSETGSSLTAGARPHRKFELGSFQTAPARHDTAWPEGRGRKETVMKLYEWDFAPNCRRVRMFLL